MLAEATATPIAHLLALKAVPPFSALPPDDLTLLVGRAKARTLLANEVLVAEGKPITSVYLVLDGRLEEYRNDRSWAERAPYDLVGGVDALAGAGEGLVVRAASPAQVLELARDDLLDVCLDRFAVLETVAAGVASMAIAARRRLGPSAGFDPPRIDEPPPRPMPDLAALVARLRAIAPLSAVPIHTLAYLAAESTQVALERGRSIWQSGDPSDHVLLVLAGTIDCTSDGTQRFVLGAGDVAGTLDAVAGVARWHDATASTPVHGLRITTAALLDVLEDDPDTAVRGLVAMACTTAELIDRVARERPARV